MKTHVKLAALTVLSGLSLHPSSFAGLAVTGVAAGINHSLFIKSDGSLWGMGDNSYGQLGLGLLSPTNTNLPAQILSSGVQRVAAGANHSLFLAGGSLWVMGYNQYGQLGDGTTNNQYVPEKIFTSSHNLSVNVMAGGYYHSLYGTFSPLVAPNNALYAMGANGAGELGDGTFTVHYSPEQLRSSTIISAVTAGEGHSFYLQSGGSLWGMGDNSFGQLGLGSLAATNIQVQLTSSGVTAVAAGTYHSLFIESDGSLWAMGDNAYGQLGDNTTTDQRTPEKIVSFGVTAVAAGNNHSLFIGSNGSLWGMGLNSRGQLGLGVIVDRHVPVMIVSSNVIAVAAAGDHSLFIKSDGSLWGMGYNGSGELGVGDYFSRTVPVRIVGGLPPPPVITGISFSGPNLMLTGTNGLNGEILYTLTSTDLAQPLSQWQSVATNVLSANGSFTITAANAVTTATPQQFYILQAQ